MHYKALGGRGFAQDPQGAYSAPQNHTWWVGYRPSQEPRLAASRLCLRSANRHQLIVPRCRLNTYGRWEFSIAGPTVWNSLPDELRDPACGSDSFKQFLKKILFSL